MRNVPSPSLGSLMTILRMVPLAPTGNRQKCPGSGATNTTSWPFSYGVTMSFVIRPRAFRIVAIACPPVVRVRCRRDWPEQDQQGQGQELLAPRLGPRGFGYFIATQRPRAIRIHSFSFTRSAPDTLYFFFSMYFSATEVNEEVVTMRPRVACSSSTTMQSCFTVGSLTFLVEANRLH